jgi:hypothetical protein
MTLISSNLRLVEEASFGRNKLAFVTLKQLLKRNMPSFCSDDPWPVAGAVEVKCGEKEQW